MAAASPRYMLQSILVAYLCLPHLVVDAEYETTAATDTPPTAANVTPPTNCLSPDRGLE